MDPNQIQNQRNGNGGIDYRTNAAHGQQQAHAVVPSFPVPTLPQHSFGFSPSETAAAIVHAHTLPPPMPVPPAASAVHSMEDHPAHSQILLSQSASPPNMGHSHDSSLAAQVYSASASPPSQSRGVKPILRRGGTGPTGHTRGVSFTLPADFEEREKQKLMNGEIARAKAKAAAESAITASMPYAQSSDGTQQQFPLSRQQKTAFHPLTTPSPRVNPILVAPISTTQLPTPSPPAHPTPFPTATGFHHQYLAGDDGSTSVAIRLPVTPGKTPSPPPPSAFEGLLSPTPNQSSTATMQTYGGRATTPHAQFHHPPGERKLYEFPVLSPQAGQASTRASPPPTAASDPSATAAVNAAAAVQAYQQQHQIHNAHGHATNVVPRLSLSSMLTPPTPIGDAGQSSSQENTPSSSSSGGSGTSAGGASSSNHTFRDGSALYTRPAAQAAQQPQLHGGSIAAAPNGGVSSSSHHRTSSTSSPRPGSLEVPAGVHGRYSPPASGPPSPSKVRAGAAMAAWASVTGGGGGGSGGSPSLANCGRWSWWRRGVWPHVQRCLIRARARRKGSWWITAPLIVACILVFLLIIILLLSFNDSDQAIRVKEDYSLYGGHLVADRDLSDDDDENYPTRRSEEKHSGGLYAWIGLFGSSSDTSPSTTVEEEESTAASFSPLNFPSLRYCAPHDLACRLQDIPLHPASSLPNHPPHKRVMLIVVNSGFAEMAMNLICSADRVGGAMGDEETNEDQQSDNGDSSPSMSSTSSSWSRGQIPRSSWLVACSDEASYTFFLDRGVAAVLMNQTSVLTVAKDKPKSVVAADGGETSSEALEASIAIASGQSQTAPIGSTAASWGESTHININREKVPLMLSLIELGMDVVLIDADVIFLRPLEELWDRPEFLDTDLQVMYDFPGLGMPEFGPSLSDCLVHSFTNNSAACRMVWEMNGGFFLLKSSPSTIALLRDMVTWLRSRPQEHDQDALRFALRTRAQEGRLKWKMENGEFYPPLSTLSQLPSNSLSYRFLPQLLAPNGGLFFTDGRSKYLEESFKLGPLTPIAVHVNWVVGHRRKEMLMKQYGWWFIHRVKDGVSSVSPGSLPNSQCTTVLMHTRLERIDTALMGSRSSMSHHPLVRPPPAKSFRVDGMKGVREMQQPPYSSSPSASLLFFTTPKPVSAFTSFPRAREPDADGMGAYDPAAPENDYSLEDRRAYLQEQQVQFRAQCMCFRNWFALTDATRIRMDRGVMDATGSGGLGPNLDRLSSSSSSSSSPSPIHTAIFSTDPAHQALSRLMHFDHFTRYDTDEYGMPKLHSLFRQAEALAKKKGIPAVMYTNGDILYHPTLLARTAAAIHSYGFEKWLGVGMRRNVESKLVDVSMDARDKEELERIQQILLDPSTATTSDNNNTGSFPLHISSLASHSYYARLLTQSHPYRTDALDFFMYQLGFFDWSMTPEFILGRIAYDNWILHYANTKVRAEVGTGFGNAAVIDLSDTVKPIHINHGEATLKQSLLKPSSDALDPTAEKLQKLMNSNKEIASHFQPNSMINIRLGGQSSLKGLGKLEHTGWKTVLRRGFDEIQVIKTRPESGHIAELYDTAQEAHVLVHERPTLIVLAVDTAHIPHMKNWLWHTRKALRVSGPSRKRPRQDESTPATPERTGILILSCSPEVTTVAKQLGVSVFELAPGERSASMLNGPSTANLQIAGLKSRAVVLLLEFGYDVLLSTTSTIWKRNPFRVLAERTRIEGSHEIDASEMRKEMDKRIRSIRNRKSVLGSQQRSEATSDQTPSSTQPSFNPSSSQDNWPMGFGLDLVALAYDSSPYNVSSQVVFYRHTPGTLKLWHRMLHSILALIQRASLPYQVNYMNLALDWFLQWELYQNHVSTTSTGGITWGSITLAAGVFTHGDLSAAMGKAPSSLSSFPHLPAGTIGDVDILFVNGWWFDRPGGLGVGFAEDNLARLKSAGVWSEQSVSPRRSSVHTTAVGTTSTSPSSSSNTEDDPCMAGREDCGSLTTAEVELLLSVSSKDQSILVVPVETPTSTIEPEELAKTPLNRFLARAIELQFKHLILVCASANDMRRALTPEHMQFGFAALYGSGRSASASASAANLNEEKRAPIFSLRMYQLLSRGFAIGLINLDTALLFGSPFELYTNREFELVQSSSTSTSTNTALSSSSLLRQQHKQAHRAFLASQGLWTSALPTTSLAMLRPLAELDCDMVGHTAPSLTPQASANNNSLALQPTAWTFLSVQPTEQSRTMLGHMISCSTRELHTASVKASPATLLSGASLNLDCLQSTSDTLQADGLLAVCPIDPYYFPSAQTCFSLPSSTAGLGPPSPSPSEAIVLARAGPWRHVSETGVYPLVLPFRYEDPLSGRVLSWADDWRTKLLDAKPPAKIVFPQPERLASVVGQEMILCKQSASAPASELPASFLFRLRVLTFDRPRSLLRLLKSLEKVDFMGDSGKIALEIFVDRPEGDAAKGSPESELAAAVKDAPKLSSSVGVDEPKLDSIQRRLQVLSLLSSFRWSHGPLSVKLHPKHVGLVGQWLQTPDPTSDHDLILVLEDDIELSTLSYAWMKGGVCRYYFSDGGGGGGRAAEQFDPNLFGLSLQKQHYVLGQSSKNVKYQFLRFKEEKAKNEQDSSSDTSTPAVTDTAALFDISSALGDPLRHPVFRYQLLGTWGCLIFPQHWLAFKSWWREKQEQNSKLLARGASQEELFEPCVPHLESSSWWSAKHSKVWSQWFIRFVFEQGWYGLYANLPGAESLALNHREAGENYNLALGARDVLLIDAPSVPASMQSSLSLSSNLRFAFPPIQSAPLFDFHFQSILVDPIVLQQRRSMHTEKQMKRGCTLKDYKPFAGD